MKRVLHALAMLLIVALTLAFALPSLSGGGSGPAAEAPQAEEPAEAGSPQVVPPAPAEPASDPEETAEPTPEPTPAPTPFAEPELTEDCLVTFDGVQLESGAYLHEGLRYVRLSEVADALGLELEPGEDGESVAFNWRRSRVSLRAYSSTLHYLDKDYELDGPVLLCDGGAEFLVPVESFCLGCQIGLLDDVEYNHLYCTPGAGDWELPQGYNVPVMMYHGVGWGSKDANLFVNTQDLEKQFVYLLDHGYTPIWFSDLEHVDQIEKPVLLTFDDGWANNYTNMLPLVEKYHVKVTVFMVWDFFTISGNHLDEDEALEMAASGYVDFQSHTMSHTDLTTIRDPEKREYELSESRLRLTRLFGKEPFVLSYPIGGSDPEIQEMASQYYRFAVKMTNHDSNYICYNTGDDPMLVYRFFPEKWTPMDTWISWLESAFPPEEEAENLPEEETAGTPEETGEASP